MWVKDEKGHLYNLAHAYRVAVFECDDGYSVVARFIMEVNFDVTLVCQKSCEEANRILRQIDYLDLTEE